MIYTPVLEKEAIREAFEILRNAFREDADEEMPICEHPAYLHRRINLYGAFGEVENDKKYWIGLGREGEEAPVFGANIAMEGSGRDGLFVKEAKNGRVLLTHSGDLRLANRKEEKYRNHHAARGCRGKLLGFTGADFWISVEGKDRLKVTPPLNSQPSDVLDEIARVYERVRCFMDG